MPGCIQGPYLIPYHSSPLAGLLSSPLYGPSFDADNTPPPCTCTVYIHVCTCTPQDELSRAEATIICNTDNQYIVPTSGNPLRGLIQDHVASGVKLTCKVWGGVVIPQDRTR